MDLYCYYYRLIVPRIKKSFLYGVSGRPDQPARGHQSHLIENAVSWLIASEVIREGVSGRRKTLHLAEAYSADRLDALIADIKAFLLLEHPVV